MDSAPGSGNSSAAREVQARTIELSSEPAAERTILDDILTQSIPAPAPSELAVLRDALRDIRGQAFSLSPVVEEMVAAILRRSQASRATDEPAFRAMAAQIATTLYDDPAARRRLAALWTRLSEG